MRSIRRQTEERWHCVVVDDGSRDGTRALCEAEARTDDRFEVLSRPHRGLVASLNEGLSRCRGEFVARMDADDVMHRERLRRQLRFLRDHPSLAAVGCHVRLFPRADLGPGRRSYEQWINGIRSPRQVRREAFVECPIAHPTLLARRAPLMRLGYHDRGWPEDYDLILRLLAAGYDLGVVPERLLSWRNHAGGLSRTSVSYTTRRFTSCKAWYLSQGFLAGSPRYALWGYGATGRALRRELLARGKAPAMIVDLHPGRIGQTIAGAPVVSPDKQAGIRDLPILASVAGAEARRQVRSALQAMGFVELRDFVVVA